MRLKISVLTAVVALLGVADRLNASIVNFTGNPQSGDTFDIKMRNRENLVPFTFGATADVAAGTAFQFGVGVVTQIDNTTQSNSAYDQTVDPGELTFTINNYDLRSVVSPFPGLTLLFFTGGNVDLFYETTKDTLTSSSNTVVPQGTNGAPDVSGQFTDGQLNLSLVGASGFFPSNLVGTAFDETTSTLVATITAVAGGGLSGNAQGRLNVAGGPLGPFFNTNAVPFPTGGFDFTLSSTLAPSGAPSGNYPVLSNDPLLTVFAAVPEPASILAWSGLVAAGALVWRRSSR